MPKDSFQISHTTALSALPFGSRVHVIGVCGSAMAQIAVLLSEQGYKVSGSDKEFYEPMKGLLARSSVQCHTGFAPDHIPSDVALVVIGNAVSYSNPEVLAVEARALPYTLFPKLLHDLVIRGKHSVVVTGTHGKTTSSALAAYVLERLQRAPSYFVGGIARDMEHSLFCGAGSVCVVEGDEYDSAFFAKVPKFTFYNPTTLVVTSVEYDHADIYPNLEAINKEFSALVLSRPATAQVIACVDTPNVAKLFKEWRAQASCDCISYGTSEESEWRIETCEHSVNGQCATVRGPGGATHCITLQIPGIYNMKNALGVAIALLRVGVTWQEMLPHFASFRGVRRRQEVRAEARGITLIEDFTKHPTGVRETLQGLRERFKDRRLVAIFEPRTNTSRRKIFQNDYVRAFGCADEVLLCRVTERSIDAGLELIDVDELAHAVKQSGVSANAFGSAAEIAAYVTNSSRAGDVLVVMSSGAFGGLIDILAGHIGVSQ